MDERLRFVARLLDGEEMARVCADVGIFRKTGYKIFKRYQDIGLQGLTDRSRRPHRQSAADGRREADRPAQEGLSEMGRPPTLSIQTSCSCDFIGPGVCRLLDGGRERHAFLSDADHRSPFSSACSHFRCSLITYSI